MKGGEGRRKKEREWYIERVGKEGVREREQMRGNTRRERKNKCVTASRGYLLVRGI